MVLVNVIPFAEDAAQLFYGSTLLLAAVRGYAGCESLAISNWLLRRDDQVGCVVFSPLDANRVADNRPKDKFGRFSLE